MNCNNRSNAFGFSAHGYNQIIVFADEAAFNEAVAANPNMTAIMGADDHTKTYFPGVFVAGVTAKGQTDKSEADLTATQTRFE